MQNIPRALLSANADNIDVHYQGDRSLFLNREPLLTNNFLFSWNDVSADPVGGYGRTSTFNLMQDCDYLGRIQLLLDFAAVTSTGAGSNYPRYVDWLGYAALDEIRVLWANNNIQTFTGDDLMILHSITRRSDDDESEMVDGGLQALPAQRATNAAASSHKVYVPLDCLVWGSQPGNFLPYNIEVFRDKIRIDVKLRSKYDLIETDGSTIEASFNDIQLRVQKVHVTDVEQASILDTLAVGTPALRLASHGRLVTVQEHQNQETVSAVTTNQTIRLQTSRPTKEIIVYWRKTSDLPTGSISAAIQHFNFQPIDEISITGSGRKILDTVEGKWLRKSVMNQFHTGDPSSHIYAIPHSLAPEAVNDQMGYINYGPIHRPEVTFKTDGAAAGQMSILYQTLNTFILAEGDARMLQS